MRAISVKRRASVTLIELLLVIAIIAIVCSISGVFIYRGIAAHRFDADVHLILEKMLMARNLSIQMDMQTELILTQEQEGLLWEVKPEKSLGKTLKTLSGGKKMLKNIKLMKVQDRAQPFLKITFMRLGTASLAGQLEFFSEKRAQKAGMMIVLDPSPHLIDPKKMRAVSQPMEEDPFPSEVADAFPK